MYRHGAHHGGRPVGPARGAPERAAPRQRHGPARPAPGPAPDRQPAQRPHRGPGLAVGGRRHRRRRVDRRPAGPTWPPSSSWGRCTPGSPSSCTRRPTSCCSPTSGPTTGSGPGSSPIPTWTPISIYRRGHFAHHKEEFGPKEPDMAFYGGYRCDRRTLGRRLVRDAVGISGWKNFTPLFKALKRRAVPADLGLDPRRAGAPVGGRCGRPPAAGGSTRCCGGCPG